MKNIKQDNDLYAYRRHVRARIKPNLMTGCVFYTPPSLGEKSTVRASPFSRGRTVRYGTAKHRSMTRGGVGGAKRPSKISRITPATQSHALSRKFSDFFPPRAAEKPAAPRARKWPDTAQHVERQPMTPANDNDQPIAADRVIEVRPRPGELNIILHRRFPRMGPAYGAQLDAAARKTFNADFSQWLGLDNRWHSTSEKYRQPRGKRRQPKATPNKPSRPARPELLDWQQDVGAPYSRWSYAVAEGAEFLAGLTVPATSGSRLMQFGAVEDAMIRAIDAKRVLAANDNVPSHRRNRPRQRAA